MLNTWICEPQLPIANISSYFKVTMTLKQNSSTLKDLSTTISLRSMTLRNPSYPTVTKRFFFSSTTISVILLYRIKSLRFMCLRNDLILKLIFLVQVLPHQPFNILMWFFILLLRYLFDDLVHHLSCFKCTFGGMRYFK
jgi:hypothetical protein